MTAWTTSRRSVLAAAGTVSLATAVAACGGSGGGDEGGQETAKETPGEEGGGGQDLGKAADIPQGGGRIFKEQKVVVTRPSGDEIKAFSAVCTHRGCIVAQVADGTINCFCHGSKFSIEDGSVEHGPATRPLPGKKVSVKGGSLELES